MDYEEKIFFVASEPTGYTWVYATGEIEINFQELETIDIFDGKIQVAYDAKAPKNVENLNKFATELIYPFGGKIYGLACFYAIAKDGKSEKLIYDDAYHLMQALLFVVDCGERR